MGISISRLGGFMKACLKLHDKHKAIIICGFCAIGKTHVVSNKDQLQQDMDIFDLDSSAYSSDIHFPQNYISEIRRMAHKRCIILISTHGGVPTQLAKEGYYVALVYPGGSLEAKREWLRRLEEREKAGKDSKLYRLTENNWNLWYARTTGEEVSRSWTLSNDQYLSDILQDIYDDFLGYEERRARTKGATF